MYASKCRGSGLKRGQILLPLHEHRHHRSPVTNSGSELLPFRRTFARSPKAGKRA